MIEEFLNNAQVGEIIRRIQRGCNNFRNGVEYFDLYEPYTKNRSHLLTGCVISRFSPDNDNFEGFQTRNVNYGLNDIMAQPELVSEECIIQIYRGNRLKNQLIDSRCELYNNDITNRPYFIIISFEIDSENQLKEINAIFKDSNSNTIINDNLYYRNELNLQVV